MRHTVIRVFSVGGEPFQKLFHIAAIVDIPKSILAICDELGVFRHITVDSGSLGAWVFWRLMGKELRFIALS